MPNPEKLQPVLTLPSAADTWSLLKEKNFQSQMTDKTASAPENFI